MKNSKSSITIEVPAYCSGEFEDEDVCYDIELDLSEVKPNFDEFLDSLRFEIANKFSSYAEKLEEEAKLNFIPGEDHEYDDEDDEEGYGKSGFNRFTWYGDAWEDVHFYDEDSDDPDDYKEYTIKFYDPKIQDVKCLGLKELFNTVLEMKSVM